ncbi:major facilitator superfamily domain-containing protein [Aspergillus alliaceus]|uniref:Major facilitator superfamily domain-containing protein n=1 Tax=Petromyces alliaceus TaxID=209559 RepID=A0A5N7BSL7_PETAA|nr:major facilitator superfamily domain-containing protein [Aspergillus alliaceus]
MAITGGPTERWNHPRSNVLKVLATYWSFLVTGMNDAAYGLDSHYSLSYAVVSLVFFSPLGGYTLSSLLNNKLHINFGRRGVALLSPGCHLIAHIINCLQPPYPVLMISFVFAGFGNGLGHAAWNAWLVLSPLITTSLIRKAHLEWYYFYYIMIGCAALELGFLLTVFWDSPATAVLETRSVENEGDLRQVVFRKSYARVTWICAQIRNGEAFASGMTATGFWLGRVLLGFVTPQVGEKISIVVLAASLQGFSLGLFFPAVVVVATELLPKAQHASAIGLTAAFGGRGAAILPFAPCIIGLTGGILLLCL